MPIVYVRFIGVAVAAKEIAMVKRISCDKRLQKYRI